MSTLIIIWKTLGKTISNEKITIFKTLGYFVLQDLEFLSLVISYFKLTDSAVTGEMAIWKIKFLKQKSQVFFIVIFSFHIKDLWGFFLSNIYTYFLTSINLSIGTESSDSSPRLKKQCTIGMNWVIPKQNSHISMIRIRHCKF